MRTIVVRFMFGVEYKMRTGENLESIFSCEDYKNNMMININNNNNDNNSMAIATATPNNQQETAKTYIPPELFPPERNLIAGSTHRLSRLELQKAINDVKKFVEARLENDLHLIKHVAPLAFLEGTGVNDELDGTESKSAVQFIVPNQDIPRGLVQVVDKDSNNKKIIKKFSYPMNCEIVQSLAKWKRIMLQRLQIPVGQGVYCDSTSIRKGYKGDVTHSVVADQWDFEIRITEQQRTVEHLKHLVRTIYQILVDAETFILQRYPDILLIDHPTANWRLPSQIHFLTAQELADEFPKISSVHERETAAVNKYGALFIIGMGWPLDNGMSPPEEVRSPGYDDWNLNGDILVRHPLTEYRHELSSMGIRVNRESLLQQLEHCGVCHVQEKLPYHNAVLENRLPLSFGGGLGISRLLMLLLRTCHIGEVQVGVWHDEHYQQARACGIDMIPDRIMEDFKINPKIHHSDSVEDLPHLEDSNTDSNDSSSSAGSAMLLDEDRLHTLLRTESSDYTCLM